MTTTPEPTGVSALAAKCREWLEEFDTARTDRYELAFRAHNLICAFLEQTGKWERACATEEAAAWLERAPEKLAKGAIARNDVRLVSALRIRVEELESVLAAVLDSIDADDNWEEYRIARRALDRIKGDQS